MDKELSLVDRLIQDGSIVPVGKLTDNDDSGRLVLDSSASIQLHLGY